MYGIKTCITVYANVLALDSYTVLATKLDIIFSYFI